MPIKVIPRYKLFKFCFRSFFIISRYKIQPKKIAENAIGRKILNMFFLFSLPFRANYFAISSGFVFRKRENSKS